MHQILCPCCGVNADAWHVACCTWCSAKRISHVSMFRLLFRYRRKFTVRDKFSRRSPLPANNVGNFIISTCSTCWHTFRPYLRSFVKNCFSHSLLSIIFERFASSRNIFIIWTPNYLCHQLFFTVLAWLMQWCSSFSHPSSYAKSKFWALVKIFIKIRKNIDEIS